MINNQSTRRLMMVHFAFKAKLSCIFSHVPTGASGFYVSKPLWENGSSPMGLGVCPYCCCVVIMSFSPLSD